MLNPFEPCCLQLARAAVWLARFGLLTQHHFEVAKVKGSDLAIVHVEFRCGVKMGTEVKEEGQMAKERGGIVV